MFKKILKETELRMIIKNLFEDKSYGPSMVNVNPVVDPSAMLTDPNNLNYKPHSKQELQVALNTLISDLSDEENISNIYDNIKNALEVHDHDKEKKKQMEKKSKNVEETIRLVIRKMLNEVTIDDKNNSKFPLVKKIPAGVHGAEYLRNYEKSKSGLRNTFKGMRDDDDAADMIKSNMPAAGRDRKNTMMGDVTGSSFKEIAAELGFAAESGAKQAVDKALQKAQFVGKLDVNTLEILTLKSMNDYINKLSGSGELSAADVQLLKDHPDIVRELNGFREFLSTSLKHAAKQSEKNEAT